MRIILCLLLLAGFLPAVGSCRQETQAPTSEQKAAAQPDQTVPEGFVPLFNGRPVLDNARLPGVPTEGPIALQHHGQRKDGEWGASFLQFRRIFIKQLSHPPRR